ncbi:MAG TPA: T9SS type A sorting domain-containing protein, partial [Bacteroidia bacterium]|nr:T9SS type A sorting domain-containing protein [Bacteroidia bacterium]
PAQPATNPQYFYDNYTSHNSDIAYDGYTIPIKTVVPIMYDSVYHIKIAIADAGDEGYDSGVFIQDSIFKCQTLPVVSLTTLGLTDTVCVGLNTYTLTGGLPTGGTYYGLGVNDTIYKTDSLAAGTYVISYTYSDSLRCSNTATHSVMLQACLNNIDLVSANNSSLQVYPNPSSGNFTVETNIAEKQTLQMFDSRGQLVLSKTINNKTSIDVSSLSDGVYSISIISYTGVINKRVIIVK